MLTCGRYLSFVPGEEGRRALLCTRGGGEESLALYQGRRGGELCFVPEEGIKLSFVQRFAELLQRPVTTVPTVLTNQIAEQFEFCLLIG